MRLPLAVRTSDNTQSTPSSGVDTGVFIGIGVALFVAVACSLLYLYLRVYRLRHPDPNWIPTTFLKSRWKAWNPLGSYGRISRPSTSRGNDNRDTPLETASTSRAPSSTQISTSTRNLDVDRRISVRSIVSLPPYHSSPLPTEQIIAREGERGGVDTVIEFPETEEEAEAQREQEMETLFSIREARRREHAEREERRRQRQEAREQHDWARLEQIEQESRARARARAASAASAGSSATTLPHPNDVGLLIAELASQRESHRDRRVSSVSYADLGLARHDGSRIRADSIESDNQPLLSSAASMGNSIRGSRQNSPFRSSHLRGPSDMSMISATSSVTSLERPITRVMTNADDLPLTPQSSASTEHNPTDTETDLGIPTTEPPSYEAHLEAHNDDAPPYESPVADRGEAPRLPDVRMHLPAIEIRSATPVNSVPVTPIMERGRRQLD